MNEDELLNEMINQYDLFLRNRADFDSNESILAEKELSVLNENASIPFLGEIKIWELVTFFVFFLVILSKAFVSFNKIENKLMF
jgi:hypothetical protein